ncbi:hypothetical protein BU17DRAFT_21133, partial [Hysterangium stoloniferum]
FFLLPPSTIFLFSSITISQANILPVLITNHTITITAKLVNHLSTIVSQCSISHPMSMNGHLDAEVDGSFDLDVLDDGRLLPVRNLKAFGTDNKYEPLPSPIFHREFPYCFLIFGLGLYYINSYGHKIHPYPNPEFLAQLSSRDIMVYSCGPFIMPCLTLHGVGAAIARSKSLRAKVLLLNSKNDRETHGLDSLDYIQSIDETLFTPHSVFITHLIYLRGSMVPVDVEKSHAIGVKCIAIESGIVGTEVVPQFTALSVQRSLY